MPSRMRFALPVRSPTTFSSWTAATRRTSELAGAWAVIDSDGAMGRAWAILRRSWMRLRLPHPLASGLRGDRSVSLPTAGAGGVALGRLHGDVLALGEVADDDRSLLDDGRRLAAGVLGQPDCAAHGRRGVPGARPVAALAVAPQPPRTGPGGLQLAARVGLALQRRGQGQLGHW